MNYETEESIWKKISASLFGVSKTADERLFTSRVMAEIRQRQPVIVSWRGFARWAIPALAISMGSFTLAVRYSLEPEAVSPEAVLQETSVPTDYSEAWLTTSHDEDEILDTVVTL